MAKPNPSYEKRVREHKKRLKREEKARRKADRIAAKKLGNGEGSTTEQPTEPNDSTERSE